MIDTLLYYLNRLRFKHSFRARCEPCGTEITAWTNSIKAVSSVAATWRASHDQCGEDR
jgi:hypothetical protein